MEGLKEEEKEEEVKREWRMKSRVGEVMEKKRGQRWRRCGGGGCGEESGRTQEGGCVIKSSDSILGARHFTSLCAMIETVLRSQIKVMMIKT